MSGIGAVPASRFTRPLPHTPLNHFLRQTKGLLASGALDNEDAVYVVTPRTPSFDQAVAAIAFAFLQQQLDQSAHTQRRYVPVISAARKTCLDDELPELALALQAALVAAENVVFEDDEEYRTVNAYASKKRVVLVGGAAEIKGKEAWNEWLELHGAQLFGVIDTDNTLPTDIHDEKGGVNERLNVALFPPQAVRGSGEAEPSLASLVALWAKQQLANASRADEEVLTRELADLLLAAVLLETDNLAESKTNSADLGAVGWLNPRSSFQLQNQDDATVAPEAQEESGLNDDEANTPNFDAYVPTFPDLDALYRALRAASRTPVKLAGLAPAAAAAMDDGATPDHYEWNLITNTLANLDEAQKAAVPSMVQQTIKGDFAAVLTSAVGKKLLGPIGDKLGQALSSGAGSLDLAALQKDVDQAVGEVVAAGADGFEALCVAISALHAFVQINWTGPELPQSLEPLALLRSTAPDAFPPRPLDADAEEKADKAAEGLLHRASLEALAFKGEPAYHLCRVPVFLVLAKLLIEALFVSADMETVAWWRLRAHTVHSHVLDEPVAFGKKVFEPVNKLRDVLAARAAATKPATGEAKSKWAALSARLILERGVALQRIGSDREAAETFVEAARQNGLVYRMSGALGKRTKFQKEDKTQLILLAKSVVADGGKEDEEADAQAMTGERQEGREGRAAGDRICSQGESGRPGGGHAVDIRAQRRHAAGADQVHHDHRLCSRLGRVGLFGSERAASAGGAGSVYAVGAVSQHPQHAGGARLDGEPDGHLYRARRVARAQLDGAHHVAAAACAARVDAHAHGGAIGAAAAGAHRPDAHQRLEPAGAAQVLPRARSAAQMGDAGRARTALR